MKLFHFVIFAGLSVICLITSLFSLNMPWVKATMKIDTGFFIVNLPMEFGLFSCFGETCKQLQDANKKFQSVEGSEQATDSESTDSEGEDFKLPPIKLPTHIPPLPPIDIPPIDLSPNPHSNDDIIGVKIPPVQPPPSYQDEYKEMLAKAEQPFKNAAMGAIPFFVLSVLVMIGTLGDLYYKIDSSFDHLTYGIAVSMVLLVFAPIMYLFFTISELNGGHYMEGMLLTTYSSILGVLFSGIGVFLMLNDKQQYIRITEDDVSVNIELGSR